MIKKIRTLIILAVILAMGAGGVYFGRGFFYGAKTIHELLTENKELKTAITNLTEEGQIGYAKVVSQEKIDGKLFTTVHFVETARGTAQKDSRKDYTIEGDIVHFDALIVKFSGEMVKDGREKGMYLWRRVYGENRAAADGFLIEQPGAVPGRYKDICSKLKLRESDMFWENIWGLANDPESLQEYGIEAIYGNAIYSRLKPGLIYVFKINSSGQVYPEVLKQL